MTTEHGIAADDSVYHGSSRALGPDGPGPSRPAAAVRLGDRGLRTQPATPWLPSGTRTNRCTWIPNGVDPVPGQPSADVGTPRPLARPARPGEAARRPGRRFRARRPRSPGATLTSPARVGSRPTCGARSIALGLDTGSRCPVTSTRAPRWSTPTCSRCCRSGRTARTPSSTVSSTAPASWPQPPAVCPRSCPTTVWSTPRTTRLLPPPGRAGRTSTPGPRSRPAGRRWPTWRPRSPTSTQGRAVSAAAGRIRSGAWGTYPSLDDESARRNSNDRRVLDFFLFAALPMAELEVRGLPLPSSPPVSRSGSPCCEGPGPERRAG